MRAPYWLGFALLLLACGAPSIQGSVESSDAASAEAKAAKQAAVLELVKGPILLPNQGVGPQASDMARLEAELGQQGNLQKIQKTSPRFSKRGLFGVFAANGGPRPRVSPVPFSVSGLVKADIPEGLSPADAPVDVLPKMETNEAKELFVDWASGFRSGRGSSVFSSVDPSASYVTVRISLQGYAMARLRIGHNEGVVSQGAGGGVYATCRTPVDTFRRIVPARWESVQSLPSGGAKLVVTDAWFDSNSCKASVVRRSEAALTSLANGVFWAYREACKDCAGAERLVLLTPSPLHISTSGLGGEVKTQLGAMTKIVLPLRKGGGASVVARYSGTVLSEWLAMNGRAGEMIPADIVAGVDVAQGVSEEEPLAIAYRSVVSGGDEGAGDDDATGQVPMIPVPVPQVLPPAPSPTPTRRLGF